MIVFRTNAPLVRLPDHPAVELSLALGETISQALPTSEARAWRKSLENWSNCFENVTNNGRRGRGVPVLGTWGFKGPPDASWPIDAVLLFHPGKRHYGQGEPIFWELKLLGDSADHAFFLEVILPALETLGSYGVPGRQYAHCLWGHFDLDSIYTADGDQWTPVARQGKLDLSYRPTPRQWARGWAEKAAAPRRFRVIVWASPVEMFPGQSQYAPPVDAPLPVHILEAFAHRLSGLLFGRYYDLDDFWSLMDAADPTAEETTDFMAAIQEAGDLRMTRDKIEKIPDPWPGQWKGFQVLNQPVTSSLSAYLALAAMIHIGRYTHFGCGTFWMD